MSDRIEPPSNSGSDSRPAACVSCHRPATDDGFCKPCAAAVELALTEDERIAMRDLLASMFEGEDGTPDYRFADHVWLTIYRAGFDIMRRSYGKPASDSEEVSGHA
jgi:hypothetical protein